LVVNRLNDANGRGDSFFRTVTRFENVSLTIVEKTNVELDGTFNTNILLTWRG
jgi:hypothetical protein